MATLSKSAGVSAGKIWLYGVIGTAVAAIANTVLYLIASATGNMPETVLVQPANQPITLLIVVGVSVMTGLVATLVFFLLARFSKNPLRIFYIIAVIILILMAVPSFTLPGAPIGMIVFLNIMHIVEAVVLVSAFTYAYNKA